MHQYIALYISSQLFVRREEKEISAKIAARAHVARCMENKNIDASGDTISDLFKA